MRRYILLIGVLLPSAAFGADYSTTERHCPSEQNGNHYCVQRPVEKLITDCDAGVNCHHMQSGQHYSVQHPVVNDG